MKKNNKLISRLIITPIGLACNREGVCVCVRIIMFDIAVFYPPAIKANIFFPNTDISSPLASLPFTFSSIVCNYLSSSLARIKKTLTPYSRLIEASPGRQARSHVKGEWRGRLRGIMRSYTALAVG